MENLESKKEPVVLNPENAFEFDIARGLRELIDDKDNFYHIEVRGDLLTVGKQGYNTPTLESVEYDMSQLAENEVLNQKKDAIREAYMYTFAKTGDLNKSANPHAFYHDRTGKYPEEEIVAAIKKLNPELIKEESTGMHR